MPPNPEKSCFPNLDFALELRASMRQDALPNNHAAFESMFEYASIGILIADATGRILRVNRMASTLFGYQPGELDGQKVEVLIPQPLRHRHEQHRAGYSQKMTPRPMGTGLDLSAVRKDGSVFPVEVSLAHYETPSGREIVSFVSDITKRKQDEADLKTLTEKLEHKVAERTRELSDAIQELQQTNENLAHEMEQRKKAEDEARQAFARERELGELKSRFVAMASHEFRTPLSGILTSVALIDRYAAGGNIESIGRHVQTIKTSVRSLTNILNDFLSLEKLDAGRVGAHPVWFGLRELCDNLVRDLQSLGKAGQILSYKHDGEDVSVCLDSEMLRNVLINLISNAIKYSAENAPILVTSACCGERVVLTVQDQGIGIPESEQKHLFERFFRAANATTLPGTGLGLHIVKRYLDQLQGTIDCKSRENAGTIFTVDLPRELKI